MNYETASRMLPFGGKQSKKIDNNTYLVRIEDYFAVRLHQTDILRFYPDGSVLLDSGGWKTPTTKDRINNYLPNGFQLRTRKRVWYLWAHGEEYLYADGMVIKGNDIVDGTVLNKETEKERERLLKSIKEYSRELVQKVVNLEIDAPSFKDCWYCSALLEETPDIFLEENHLLSHLEEKYYVPSLFWSAMKEAKDHMSIYDRMILSELWTSIENKKKTHNLNDDLTNWALMDFPPMVERYIRTRLGFAR